MARRRNHHGGMAVAVAASACLLLTALEQAFVAPSRRHVVSLVALAPMAARADSQEPLPPPVLKDVSRSAAKVQDGADWLYFNVKPALDREDLSACRESLGGSLVGAHVSPLETDLMMPLEQLISANVEAEEDGWVNALREVRVAIDQMKDLVGGNEWAQAKVSWDRARAGANKILSDINARGEKQYFVELDDDYEAKRYELYLRKKKDTITFRNQVGTLALR
mmetsp:Transcript_12547/g.29463  ORF Transcript_12547/g.29463 Transcript_12547/m.29463 type:complete len:223 (-) Transcript_12547:65-733(-)|eukprot:CAMPEP_0171104588 /NCGR_PEP_ID=MMETSP0766_2-20121228/60963_1 /TAXON_ID=439317 /ORGANISM="Gambierdiscus australes, Strain CAWD 149" /LENGTH=222 /DNA_ID=CAMNT_0011565239 /DNA_START=35 /DNA_END=703 /DNA_ORIENTATION=+